MGTRQVEKKRCYACGAKKESWKLKDGLCRPCFTGRRYK